MYDLVQTNYGICCFLYPLKYEKNGNHFLLMNIHFVFQYKRRPAPGILDGLLSVVLQRHNCLNNDGYENQQRIKIYLTSIMLLEEAYTSIFCAQYEQN